MHGQYDTPVTLFDLFASQRDECPEAGIVKRSIPAIDRTLLPKHGQIIVAEIDGEPALRGQLLEPVSALQALNEDEKVMLLDQDAVLPVWGVVAYALTEVAGVGF